MAVDIFTHLVLAKATGLDPQLCPQSASAVSVEKFLSTSRSLCQGIMDAHYVRKTDPNKVYTEVSETDGCLSICKMYLDAHHVRKTDLNKLHTEVSETDGCLSICKMYLDAHHVRKTDPNKVHTEVSETDGCLSICKMYLDAHNVCNCARQPPTRFSQKCLKWFDV